MQREAAATSDAWETPLGGHYGAGGTLGGDREPEEGEAKGALRMGRASFWAAPAWAGRGAVPDGLSQPGWSIRGPPLAQPLPIPTFTPPTWRKAALGFGPASVVPQSSPPASARWVLHRRGVCSFFFLKQRDLLFASCWPSPQK